jgi:hypothetical protein
MCMVAWMKRAIGHVETHTGTTNYDTRPRPDPLIVGVHDHSRSCFDDGRFFRSAMLSRPGIFCWADAGGEPSLDVSTD